MKVISGFLKGHIIPTLKGAKYRPSTGKFKEAMFSILTSGEFATEGIIYNKEVLDLFAGTCSLGFEALSRGAKHVTFVDVDQPSLDLATIFAMKKNIEDKTNFVKQDATRLSTAKKQYDLVFMDPPYDQDMASKALSALDKYGWLKETAIIVVETGSREKLTYPERYSLIDERVYGISKMTILRYL